MLLFVHLHPWVNVLREHINALRYGAAEITQTHFPTLALSKNGLSRHIFKCNLAAIDQSVVLLQIFGYLRTNNNIIILQA